MKFKDWYKGLSVGRRNKLVNGITELIVNIYILNICQKCKRKLPNKSFFIENGCKWCDSMYHFKKVRKINNEKS